MQQPVQHPTLHGRLFFVRQLCRLLPQRHPQRWQIHRVCKEGSFCRGQTVEHRHHASNTLQQVVTRNLFEYLVSIAEMQGKTHQLGQQQHANQGQHQTGANRLWHQSHEATRATRAAKR